MTKLAESHVEEAALAWLEALGYQIAHGPDLSPEGAAPERTSYADVVLVGRLLTALTESTHTYPPRRWRKSPRSCNKPNCRR